MDLEATRQYSMKYKYTEKEGGKETKKKKEKGRGGGTKKKSIHNSRPSTTVKLALSTRIKAEEFVEEINQGNGMYSYLQCSTKTP